MGMGLLQQFKNDVDRNLTQEPTGFVYPESVVVSYNSTTRKVTLTGDCRALWRGSIIDQLVSGWESAAHAATVAAWFLYYDGTAFIWSNLPWEFDKVMIACIDYQTAYKFALREPHGLMPYQSHRADHKTVGTYRDTGGDVSDYVLNSTVAANRRPLISTCTIWDEDVPTTNAALATESYTRMWLSGASGVVNFATASADIVSVTGNVPNYNQFTGGSWQQTALPTNQYMCLWLMEVPVTNDAGSQAFRHVWLQGQSQGSLASQQAMTTNNLNMGEWGSLIPEFVFIQKVIIRYTNGNWIWIETAPITGSRAVQVSSVSGFFLSSVNHNATLTGSGTTEDPLSLSGIHPDGGTLASGGDTVLDALYFG
jgi:hypothetical protein